MPYQIGFMLKYKFRILTTDKNSLQLYTAIQMKHSF